MKALYCLLFTVIAMMSTAHADSRGIPRVNEHKLQLNETGQIALEVMAGQVMAQTGKGFSDIIRLVWADGRFASSAKTLRSMLIGKGISPERILLIQESGGYQREAVSGLNIWIRQVVLRLPECNYAAQNYRFNYRDELGCAVNNTRSSIIINPNKFHL
ncbi:hypothetical protein BV924_00065 [Pectobacterium odoriferum]|uniref:Pilus assembly protein n=1 Tax=Pectobacterium odoriferum TaxID=78398 RepID=A0ABD6VVW4_9GAMM|nr:hypothetical protein [Pectobacterium odoriferum]POD97227.1 hypothetical protein BVY06_07930 [Pectobacterium odoriferum]POE15213.1 hypothetical protein BV924_00065 [Pectobacterium odoriferum]POE24172.1 hypothetical protein BV923_05150 [Pectobacterium odoriferum]POE28750.1 hypothetical protein BV926_00065 [Pectobacterium odoriferum]POE34100.1 hypothetical protein BV919_00065 [Pectobacterium odoriferum]